MKICPKCKTPAPDNTEKCWCGYNFSTIDNNRISIAIICLHIAAISYLLIFGYLIFHFLNLPKIDVLDQELTVMLKNITSFYIIIISACLGLAILNEVVAKALEKRKFWGWVGGIILFALYIPSPLFPIGGFGLWALLTHNSRKIFLTEKT